MRSDGTIAGIDGPPELGAGIREWFQDMQEARIQRATLTGNCVSLFGTIDC